MSYHGFAFWWIFPLVFGSFWILLFTLGFWRFRHWGWHPHDWRSPDATEILKQRFARGDIDADEYKSRLRVIERPQG
jgi:uncharacterized membrane protein